MLAVEKRVTSPLLVSWPGQAGLAGQNSPQLGTPYLLPAGLILCPPPRLRPSPPLPPPAPPHLPPQEPSSIEKVAEVDSHVGVAMSGLTADARTLIDHGRVEAQQHRFTYNEPMPVESLTQSLCDLALRFGEDDEGGGGGGMSRPFGVALLVAGWDPDAGPVL